MNKILVVTFQLWLLSANCDSLYYFCKPGNKHKIFIWRGKHSKVVPLKQSIKSAELFFIYRTVKINQTMEVSIYESNCLPQNTQSHRLSSILRMVN